MTNFDYLKNEPKFNTFSNVAIAAEKILYIDPTTCIINCRRAMEFAIKWMYSVDSSLHMPYQDNLISLMSTEEFRDIIDDDLMKRMDFIRKMGNNAAHSGKKITEDQAILCLENLQIFFYFVCYCYSDQYEEHIDWYRNNPDDYISKMRGEDKDLAAHFTIITHRGEVSLGRFD